MSKGIISSCRRMVERHSLLRFVITGGLAAAVHYGIYYLMVTVGLPMEVSYATGWAVSLGFNFWMSGWFTFRTTLTIRKGLKFLGSHLINLTLQFALLEFWVRVVNVPKLVAPLLILTVTVPVNFLLVRHSMKDKKFCE